MMLAWNFDKTQDSPDCKFLAFASNHPKGPELVHAFVEGESDKSFYRKFLDLFVSETENLRIYPCNGKEDVYNTFHKIKHKYSPEVGTTLYFVDKDLSDILNEDWEQAPNIYVTDYYSIENYLVSEDMLARIWSELFRFKGGSLEFSRIHREKFVQELDRFYQFVTPLIAWTILLRRLGRKPNVNNIKFSRFFYLDDQLALRKAEEFTSLGDFGLVSKVCGEQVSDDLLIQISSIEK